MVIEDRRGENTRGGAIVCGVTIQIDGELGVLLVGKTKDLDRPTTEGEGRPVPCDTRFMDMRDLGKSVLDLGKETRAIFDATVGVLERLVQHARTEDQS